MPPHNEIKEAFLAGIEAAKSQGLIVFDGRSYIYSSRMDEDALFNEWWEKHRGEGRPT